MNTLTQAYSSAPFLHRVLVRARPTICPYEPILAPIPSQATVLDVGCGVGALLVSLALRGDLRAGIGCDINPASVGIAQTAAQQISASSLQFMASRDINDIPRGPFEVVTLIDVMHHVNPTTQREFFGACAERVSEGGILLYKDMANKPLWKNLFNRLHDAVLARQIIHYVPISQIKDWGQSLGFTIDKQDAYSRLAYAHELVVFRNRKQA